MAKWAHGPQTHIFGKGAYGNLTATLRLLEGSLFGFPGWHENTCEWARGDGGARVALGGRLQTKVLKSQESLKVPEALTEG